MAVYYPNFNLIVVGVYKWATGLLLMRFIINDRDDPFLSFLKYQFPDKTPNLSGYT